MKFFQEFKEFAVKGNVIDMAIGIIIGTAFNKIVSSLVSDIITPPIGYFLGNVDFTDLKIVLQQKEVAANGEVLQELVAINYGNFIQVGIDFLLIAFSMFIVIKVMNSVKRKSEDEGEASVPTPKNIQLLSEIRDLMKQQVNK
ncbi:MAG: large-conductance mechanosensitive channel protein MscL [Chitinophagales bacterium]